MTTPRKGRDRTVGPEPSGNSRPEPVLKAAIAPTAVVIVGLLTVFGVHLDPDQRNTLLVVITALIPLVTMAANWWARRQVTPLSDPRDRSGRRLAPVGGGTARRGMT